MPSLFLTTNSRVTAECLSVGFFVALIQRVIMRTSKGFANEIQSRNLRDIWEISRSFNSLAGL